MERSEELTRRLNSTGFLLQLAVEQEILERTRASQRVPVDEARREVPWRDPVTGDEGYLDLVMRRHRVFFLFECKRPKGSVPWLFLAEARNRLRRSGTLLTEQPRYAFPMWEHPILTPDAPIAEFCSIQGEGGDRPRGGRMLERDAGQLVQAIRGFATEDHDRQVFTGPRVFVPTIVTTAPIAVRAYEPGELDHVTGTIADGAYDEVEWVMFQKPLTPYVWPPGFKGDRTDLDAVRNPTIIVVNARRMLRSSSWLLTSVIT